MFGPRQAVVPRAACTHHRIVLPGLGKGREGALALAVRRLSPQPGVRHASVWQGNVAHVWVLDGRACADAGEMETLVAESSLLPPPPTAEAVRLVRLVRGVEGQVWREGALTTSRWWPDVPDMASWGRFLRAASLSVDQPVPEVEALPLQASPWGAPSGPIPWAPAQLEAVFWRSVAFGCGALVGFPLIAALVWQIATFQMARDLEAVRTASAPLIDARERAERDRDRAEALLALAEGPRDYLLLADARDRLPEDDRLVGWLRDGDRLRVEVIAGSTDPRQYVQAFAGHPALAEVVANPAEGGRMQLEFELPSPEAAR